jgi:hypothetical protein
MSLIFGREQKEARVHAKTFRERVHLDGSEAAIALRVSPGQTLTPCRYRGVDLCDLAAVRSA